jgi:hypothetical protein
MQSDPWQAFLNATKQAWLQSLPLKRQRKSRNQCCGFQMSEREIRLKF